MPSISSIAYYLVHPQELRSVIQWMVWHTPVHERDLDNEPPSLQACFDFLDHTSRSFASVIKELNHELLVPICIFYLVLRGLDTVEDDMTIDIKEKDPLLRSFHEKLEQDGWNYSGNHAKEKDRILLIHFEHVVTEFKKLKEPYKVIIKDICDKMGNGMADYCQNAEFNEKGIDTIEQYEEYCHYVAGLVGEGLTRLFVESGLANPALLQRPDLYESMGQLLQQTNIIRDIVEDHHDNRRFWPRQIWSKYVTDFEDLMKPENKEIALRCSSEMVSNALEKVPDCLFYLAGIREQSVFNFAAIPQSMAIATLEICFRNEDLFKKNVKITKGTACRIMINSSQNLQILYGVFKDYARRIHKKNNPMDPNFLKISVQCGKIEQFIESIFPTQDPRTIGQNPEGQDSALLNGAAKRTAEEMEKKKKEEAETRRDAMIIIGTVGGFMIVVAAIMFWIAYMFGARFDLAIDSLRSGNYFSPGKEQVAQARADRIGHGEL